MAESSSKRQTIGLTALDLTLMLVGTARAGGDPARGEVRFQDCAAGHKLEAHRGSSTPYALVQKRTNSGAKSAFVAGHIFLGCHFRQRDTQLRRGVSPPRLVTH